MAGYLSGSQTDRTFDRRGSFKRTKQPASSPYDLLLEPLNDPPRAFPKHSLPWKLNRVLNVENFEG